MNYVPAAINRNAGPAAAVTVGLNSASTQCKWQAVVINLSKSHRVRQFARAIQSATSKQRGQNDKKSERQAKVYEQIIWQIKQTDYKCR